MRRQHFGAFSKLSALGGGVFPESSAPVVAVPPVNYAAQSNGGAATANHELAGIYVATFANDGLRVTAESDSWIADSVFVGNEAIMTIALPAAKTVKKFDVFFHTNGAADLLASPGSEAAVGHIIQDFIISTSPDGVIFTPRHTVTGNTAWWREFDDTGAPFAGVTHVRLSISQTNDGYARTWEFEVWA